MSKLLFSAAVLAASFVMADITSSNIVGYSTTTLAGKTYSATGASFISPGASEDATFTLAGFVPSAYDWESDYLYVMNPEDSSADASLIYLDADTAAAFSMTAGWYDADSLESYNDIEWTIGTGFMTSFGSGLPDFTSSGEVFPSAFTIDLTDIVYSIVPNALPRTITLSEVTATGYDWESDYLCVMNPEDSSADASLIYLDADTAAAFSMTAGWYDADSLESFADYEVKPGEGFMTSFGGANVTINFPAAL